MCRPFESRLFGTALAIALSLSTPAAAADRMPTVLVYLANNANIPSGILREARAEVVNIYERIGVKVIWAEDLTGGATDRLMVIMAPAITQLHAPPAALGLALRSSGSFGRAYVFYDRVEAVAANHRMTNACLLGVAVAHELGHLLLPYGSHSLNGLMRGDWDDAQLLRARAGYLRFTVGQGELIRARLAVSEGQSDR